MAGTHEGIRRRTATEFADDISPGHEIVVEAIMQREDVCRVDQHRRQSLAPA
jgi:hypothetical protein